MCVIAYWKKKPSLDTLNRMHKENPDGMGIMYFKGGLTYYQKGIVNVNELFTITQKINLPFVTHFRLASCGGKNLLLCHPFEVNRKSKLRLHGKAKRLLVHNGTHKDFNEYMAAAGIYNDTNEEMSDTRAIAMIIAKNNTRFLTTFGDYAHKFILSDANLKKFITFGYFIEEDGNFFSNLKWKYTYVGTNYGDSEFFGRVSRGYSSPASSNSTGRYDSDVNRLPTHYQPQPKEYDIKETLAELMNKKNRKRYVKWFERREIKIKNPFVEILPTEKVDTDIDVEQFIKEFHNGKNVPDITINSPEQSNVPNDNPEKYTRIHEQSDAQFIKNQNIKIPEPAFVKRASNNLRRILGLLPIKYKDTTDYALFPVKNEKDIDI